MSPDRSNGIGIARCEVFEAGPTVAGPCQSVLGVQSMLPLHERQVPEPWRGSTDAPLLFLSSNPSLDLDDDSPLQGHDDDAIASYFDSGFPSCFPKTRLRDGTPRPTVVPFWVQVRSRAADLWGLEPSDLRPGSDFAITEVVHCKSRSEHGVDQARNHCLERHAAAVFSVCSAKVVVALGRIAAQALNHPSLDLRSRIVLELPHPNAFTKGKGSKALSRFCTPTKLQQIQALLRESRLP